MVLVWGEQSTGKTMLGLCTIAKMQQLRRKGYSEYKKPAVLDIEGALDKTFMKGLGVDIDDLVWMSGREATSSIKKLEDKPITGEEWFDIINMLIQSDEIGYIMVDSITSMIPARIMATESTDIDAKKAALAQLTSAQLPITSAILQKRTDCVVNLVAQARKKVMSMFGPSEYASGGTAPGFYGSYVFQIKKIKPHWGEFELGGGKTIKKEIGCDVRLLIEKNKTAAKSEPVHFHVDFESGVDVMDDVVQAATMVGVVQKSSSYYSYGDIKENGITNFKDALDPDIVDFIRNDTLERMKAIVMGGPVKISHKEPGNDE